MTTAYSVIAATADLRVGRVDCRENELPRRRSRSRGRRPLTLPRLGDLLGPPLSALRRVRRFQLGVHALLGQRESGSATRSRSAPLITERVQQLTARNCESAESAVEYCKGLTRRLTSAQACCCTLVTRQRRTELSDGARARKQRDTTHDRSLSLFEPLGEAIE